MRLLFYSLVDSWSVIESVCESLVDSWYAPPWTNMYVCLFSEWFESSDIYNFFVCFAVDFYRTVVVYLCDSKWSFGWLFQLRSTFITFENENRWEWNIDITQLRIDILGTLHHFFITQSYSIIQIGNQSIMKSILILL